MDSQKTDNELIAEFMGAVESKDSGVCGIRTYWINNNDRSPTETRDMHYAESWDWLMPVVENIAEKHDFTIQFYDGNCNCYCTKQNLEESDIPSVGHGGFKPNIQSVYKSVVAFVKWYNAQQYKD